MAKTSRSAYSRSTYVTSNPSVSGGGMSVWALRDFVHALDELGVPDDERVEAHHNDTRHLTHLSVRWYEALPEPAGEAP